MSKKVIISGLSGMDGSHMADYLIKNTDYEIYGLLRRNAVPNPKNYAHLISNPRFHMVTGDLSDGSNIHDVVLVYQPDYWINFAAQSQVGTSWEVPEQTFDIDANGVIRILEAIRKNKPSCRYYNAASSEIFGDVEYSPQDIKHPLKPRSPYGAAKAASHLITKVYRESYNLYAVSGILYNHESERRGQYFVTQKIVQNVARIKKSIEHGEDFEPLELGNLDSKRDWSYAPDFMDGVWRMLNQDQFSSNNIDLKTLERKPKIVIKDYILASGETYMVREFVELAFSFIGIEGVWAGSGLEEKFLDSKTNRPLVVVNEKYYRPAEVDLLLGDASLAKEELGWQPKTSFEQLVKIMVQNATTNF